MTLFCNSTNGKSSYIEKLDYPMIEFGVNFVPRRQNRHTHNSVTCKSSFLNLLPFQTPTSQKLFTLSCILSLALPSLSPVLCLNVSLSVSLTLPLHFPSPSHSPWCFRRTLTAAVDYRYIALLFLLFCVSQLIIISLVCILLV